MLEFGINLSKKNIKSQVVNGVKEGDVQNLFDVFTHIIYEWVSVLVFYVTCNDISVIYVTAQMCRRTEEEVVPTVGVQTQLRHFVGFFNVPVLHRHGIPFLYGYSEKPPHFVAFYDTLGYGGCILVLNLPASAKGHIIYEDDGKKTLKILTHKVEQ